MDATLTINSGPNATTAYLGWSPVSARLALSNVPAGGATVTLRNRKPGSGGQVCFKLDRQPPFDTTLTLHVANDHAVDLFVAGQFQHPSTSNRDATIEVINAGTNQRLSVTKLMVRVRKDASSLTAAERRRFLEALGALNDSGSGTFSDFPSMHKGLGLQQAHGNAGFLPWHRAMLLDLERKLQAIDPTVALPYWRFDTPAPSLFTAGYMGASTASGDVQFAPGHPLESWVTESWPGVLRTPRQGAAAPMMDDTLMKLADPTNRFSTWRAMEGNPHGRAHTLWTGFLFDPKTAARDPLFYLLHANVDRLWARWQWLKRRFDVSSPATFKPQGVAGSPGSTDVGHNLDDTLWPWNGDTGPGRPPTAPGGPFPPSTLTAAPGPTPALAAMIDYRGVRNQATWLGYDYDDVPFAT